MKKILLILMVILLCSCSKENKVNYTYNMQSEKVDMSAYSGVSSTNHNFRLIVPSELYKCIDNKSSGVFYLGRNNCACCQKVCRYLSQVANELDVTVYYIDVFNQKEPLTDKANQDRMYEYLYDILGIDDNGEKVLLTPQVFSIVNGEFFDSLICYDGIEMDSSPTKNQIEVLKQRYRDIMKPFSSSKSS